ncbi:hypothetical protein AKJ47_00810 [candidate division MSBL1 archaeon SCGC-AAA261G05]|uniref:Uncharacterized protein n=2 Tax=candidate division MSBL1 TaxID=215777 RepID=A0A133V1Q0_9EURY|nr:hypothetical protein AKJ42_01130 [candidate division MSBL1 archaeon SCGC-AAA261C02]KXB04068.1 hypothetical protein AKJ47_00810 [candidate division MSBL1 archaeon SCGC-AAA261G05]
MREKRAPSAPYLRTEYQYRRVIRNYRINLKGSRKSGEKEKALELLPQIVSERREWLSVLLYPSGAFLVGLSLGLWGAEGWIYFMHGKIVR